MTWLNYHHLLYFWTVAREGGLGPASQKLRLARPTLSAQIRTLEAQLGAPLFAREGRRLVLTEIGHVVSRYAEEIFSLGDELLAAVRGGVVGTLTVGVLDAVPKMIVRRLLRPVWTLSPAVHVVCVEDSHTQLLARLSTHELDVVVSDSPIAEGATVRAYSHLLGESGVTFFGAGRHASLRGRFPASLDGAPILLPLRTTPLRRSLDQWLEETNIRPRVVGEFEDSALLKACAREGVGITVGPSAVEREIVEQYGFRVLGRAPTVRERFWLISPERRLKHPAVVAISDGAKLNLSADPAARRSRRRTSRESTARPDPPHERRDEPGRRG